MKEGIKKNIYNELRMNNVLVEEKNQYTQYTFGRYRIDSYWDHLFISKLNPENGAYVYMSVSEQDTDWSNDYPKNSAYEIFIAVVKKAKGEEYIDPYKNIPVKDVVKDSVNKFEKTLKEYAADIFPYDMTEQQYEKTITEMKNVFAQKIKQYKTQTK